MQNCLFHSTTSQHIYFRFSEYFQWFSVDNNPLVSHLSKSSYSASPSLFPVIRTIVKAKKDPDHQAAHCHKQDHDCQVIQDDEQDEGQSAKEGIRHQKRQKQRRDDINDKSYS